MKITDIKVIDFTQNHVTEAKALVMANYEEERIHVPTLPPIDEIPELPEFADNGLSVAAFEGNRLVGFLCGAGVWENAWDIPGVNHVFSPMGGNAAVPKNRAKIYAAMYQAVSKKWANAGAASHGISLYAHDKEVQEQLFRYGFGMRCIDAIRRVEDIDILTLDGYRFLEPEPDEVLEILPLENMLKAGFAESPTFMYKEPGDEKGFMEAFHDCNSIYTVAKYEGKIIAFIRAERDGETFIKDLPGYIHINGVYCLPEHRGKGINQSLLCLLVQNLRRLGYTHLGVDYESINPFAYGFWQKHFTSYTHSVVRRIDENTMEDKI